RSGGRLGAVPIWASPQTLLFRPSLASLIRRNTTSGRVSSAFARSGLRRRWQRVLGDALERGDAHLLRRRELRREQAGELAAADRLVGDRGLEPGALGAKR